MEKKQAIPSMWSRYVERNYAELVVSAMFFRFDNVRFFSLP